MCSYPLTYCVILIVITTEEDVILHFNTSPLYKRSLSHNISKNEEVTHTQTKIVLHQDNTCMDGFQIESIQ